MIVDGTQARNAEKVEMVETGDPSISKITLHRHNVVVSQPVCLPPRLAETS